MAVPKITQVQKRVLTAILVSAVLIMLMLVKVVAIVKIEGPSMLPNLKDSDRVIILRPGILNPSVDRFDIVVFHSSNTPPKRMIKRVIGLPGEHIQVEAGIIYINGRPLVQPFTTLSTRPPDPLPDFKGIRIPASHYFVIGDNREISKDSRFFGTVHIDRITGRAFFRYWPFARLGGVS